MNTSSALRSVVCAAAFACLGSAPLLQAQVSLRYISRQGFADPRHTRADGYQFSEVLALSAAGYTVGESQRFFGTPHPQYGALPDRSAWIGSPYGGSKSIGLYDAVHRSATGYHTADVLEFTRTGFAVGHSVRYNGEPVSRGQSAWLASWSGGTRRIGLFYDNEEPPMLDGSLYNYVVDVNHAGQAIGYAPKIRGREAWLADAAGNQRTLGFYDQAHMSQHFEPHNTPVAINPSGTIVGHTLWGGGQVVWLHSKNGGPPVQIGLYDADHTYSDGTVLNSVAALNSHGYVVGRARNIYLGESDSDPLYSMWLWKPAGTTQTMISNGSADAQVLITNSNLVAGDEHASPSSHVWLFNANTGEQFSLGLAFDTEVYSYSNHLRGLTENGIVLGSAGWSRGTYAWMANASGQMWRLGFDYNLGAPGAVRSVITAFAPNGVTVGYSDGGYGEGYGEVGWIANPNTGQSYAIGLKDEVHLNGSDVPGYSALPTHVTSSKFVAGYNVRYHGDNTEEGQTAWIYNSPKARYAKLELSLRASDGYAFSQVNQLLESGVAIGTYTKFADDGTDLGDRAFVWVTGKGVFDIGERLNVDPESVNWDYLATAVLANEAGFIAGHGVPFDSTSQGVFLIRIEGN